MAPVFFDYAPTGFNLLACLGHKNGAKERLPRRDLPPRLAALHCR
jgi:hypothetical protein